MPRPTLQFAFVLSAFLAISNVVPPGFSGEPNGNAQLGKAYPSPQAAFDAYRTALDKHDWRTVFLSESQSARDDDLFEAVFACGVQSENLKIVGVRKQFGLDRDWDVRVNSEY